jgi:SAM-dependent methyltransferase
VNDDWTRATVRAVASFDKIADLYGRAFADKLECKPFDQQLFDALAARLPTDQPVLEVGAGPGQVSTHLARYGLTVVASDASLGQLRHARALDPVRRLVAADLACLPVRSGCLAGIIAYYCLMYGPAVHLDGVFAEWYRALRSDGLAAIAVHAGTGTIHATEWQGRPVDIQLTMREPDDLIARLRHAGFVVDTCVVRRPYTDEHPTDRCYIIARRF